ncbi:MAG: hypothetical protein HZB14_04930 [Actinobacteria bacterium]|nr:hypothetical protein [Actinomycetota bacterium]
MSGIIERMNHRNLMPPLNEEPRDARASNSTENATRVLYRLGLQSDPVPGLPDQLKVDDVTIEFVDGPIRTQITEMRQRHGLPIEFDKSMRREDLGANSRIALLSIEAAPVPANLDSAFTSWRSRALAAAGLLASILDERVVGAELLEDAVLFRDDEVLGGVDMRTRVRSYLPLEVRRSDLETLAELQGISLSESSAAARAARLYRQAMLEGPTADAYAMLWVAAECFSEHRTPSRKDIEAALVQAGLDPAGLPVHVGLLIDLRAEIQHHGVEDHDNLAIAFYEMEAVVRALIRQNSQTHGGWPPLPNNPGTFSDPFDSAVAQLQGRGSSHWHADGLPPVESPVAQNLPRRVLRPELDERVDLDPDLGDTSETVASVVVDAIEWLDPELRLFVSAKLPDRAPDWVMSLATPDGIHLAPQFYEGVHDDATLFVNFVWDLFSLVGAVLMQRAGVKSEGTGVAVVEAFGAFTQYRRLAQFGAFDPELLRIPDDGSPISLGKVAGWAAAGDSRASEYIVSLDGSDLELVNEIVSSLQTDPLSAPTHLIELAQELASENDDDG